MIYPTTEEEKRAFYQAALPGFLEYLRTHMSAIEQVELADTREGIVSFPATQVLGGVQKTVRVPLSLLMSGVDAVVADTEQATEYANEQGDYAKGQGDYAKNQGDYAKEKGDYALEKGNFAKGLYDTISLWYNGTNNNGFKNNAEELKTQVNAWYTAITHSWEQFYTEGAVVDWNEFWSNVLMEWQEWKDEEEARKGILCLDFDYDFENGELVMDFVERDSLSQDMFSFADGDFIIDYNI